MSESHLTGKTPFTRSEAQVKKLASRLQTVKADPKFARSLSKYGFCDNIWHIVNGLAVDIEDFGLLKKSGKRLTIKESKPNSLKGSMAYDAAIMDGKNDALYGKPCASPYSNAELKEAYTKGWKSLQFEMRK